MTDMGYNKYIYMLCNETDLDSRDSVVKAMQSLAIEAISNKRALEAFEKEVEKMLTVEQFKKASMKAAHNMVREDIDNMEGGELKDFLQEHLTEIIGEEI